MIPVSSERPLFILAGNGPYENRGCEAITRGTVRIIRECFKDPEFLCFSHFQSDEQYRQQSTTETDKGITHLQSFRLNKNKAIRSFWRPRTWSYAYRSIFNLKMLKYDIYRDLIDHVDAASAVLSVGGDNYSLDYGIPHSFTGLDDIIIERNKPMVIWGASVGPFNSIPNYEKYMSEHLRQISAIFARESATVDYLKRIGVVENVYPTADPAFLMEPKKPEGIEEEMPIDEGSIGINLSPLMAKYVTGGDLGRWVDLAASIIKMVSQRTEMPVYLIPHVTTPSSNDHEFMRRALSRSPELSDDVMLVPPKFNAAETKWIIGQMSVFAGARTHSTIAAISSGVPTLSFAYSLKARGINQDVFNHTGYCLDPSELNPDTVSEKMINHIANASAIRKYLESKRFSIQQQALEAGKKLKTIFEGGMNAR